MPCVCDAFSLRSRFMGVLYAVSCFIKCVVFLRLPTFSRASSISKLQCHLPSDVANFTELQPYLLVRSLLEFDVSVWQVFLCCLMIDHFFVKPLRSSNCLNWLSRVRLSLACKQMILDPNFGSSLSLRPSLFSRNFQVFFWMNGRPIRKVIESLTHSEIPNLNIQAKSGIVCWRSSPPTSRQLSASRCARELKNSLIFTI